MTSNVVKFTSAPKPVQGRNFLRKRITGAWNVLTGKAFAIQPMEQNDFVVGQFTVHMGTYLNRVVISGRDFFFAPDGSFDGTGMAVSGRGVPESLD